MGYQWFEPMVHFGRELMSEAGYFHTVSMFDDPFRIEQLWRNVYGSGYTLRPDVSLGGVLSGIETACWDIVGKEVGRPIYDLLGGRVHERLRSYTYLYPSADEGADFYADPDRSAARAAEYVERGWTALKFDPAGPYSVYDGRQPGLVDLQRSVEFLAKLRDAVGNRADLLFGTHGQFTASGAIRMAAQIEHHFNHYKDLKKPGTTKVLGFGSTEDAWKVIAECVERAENE